MKGEIPGGRKGVHGGNGEQEAREGDLVTGVKENRFHRNLGGAAKGQGPGKKVLVGINIMSRV